MLIGCLNDSFRSFRALNAEQLFKASSLGFIRCLFEFVFPLLLAERLLLEHLHQFHVQLVTLFRNELLRFTARDLASRAHHLGSSCLVCAWHLLCHHRRLFLMRLRSSLVHESAYLLAISGSLRRFNLQSHLLLREVQWLSLNRLHFEHWFRLGLSNKAFSRRFLNALGHGMTLGAAG